MSDETLPIAIYYEQPNWFKPLFAELDRRGTKYVKLDAVTHSYSPPSTRRRSMRWCSTV